MDNEHDDYAKLMDDLERQDRLLLMVTDRLVDTIEELKLAYAAKDSSALTDSTSTSTISIPSTASTPQATSTPSCCACTARAEGSVNSENSVDKQTFLAANVTPESKHLSQDKSQERPTRRGPTPPQTLGNLGSKTTKYLETDIDAVSYTDKNMKQEWTVTLTDGTGKSRTARSVNQRIGK